MASRERAMNAGAMLMQILAQVKEMGLGENVNRQLMTKNLAMDEDMAALVAKGIQNAPKPDEGGGFGGGGGLGGADDDKQDFDIPQGGEDDK